MPGILRQRPSFLSVAALLLAVGCGEGPTGPSSIIFSIVSGNAQSGVVGQELPSPLVVRVTSTDGSPISGLTMEFAVISGGGSMQAVPAVSNGNGEALNYWTLGTATSIQQRVEVRAILSNGGQLALGTFDATPRAGPAFGIVAQAGGGQSVFKGTALPVAAAVLVTDEYGNPVPGVPVTFAVTSGGGSVAGASPLTNTSGIATVGSWTVGPTSGPNTLTAALESGSLHTFLATAKDWYARAPMLTPRLNAGVGVINGVLYVVGGGDGNTPAIGTVEAYDLTTDTWTVKAPMPTPRYAFGVAVANGLLYAVGGHNDFTILGTVEVYDPVSNSWTTRAPMPTPRGALGVAVVNGVLYAIGGKQDLFQLFGTVEAYDLATNTWSTRASKQPRFGMGVGVVNGVLHTVGGNTASSTTDGVVESYDPLTDSWTSLAPMPAPRQDPIVGVVNGVLYVAGGRTTVQPVGTVHAFNASTNSWTAGDPMLTTRYRMGGGVLNGVLYAIGGNNGIGAVPTVEAFVP